jgi:EpsI family protein
MLILVAVGSLNLPERAESIPQRTSFGEYPNTVGGWTGRREALEAIYLNQLMLDDYYLADFTRDAEPPINYYIAWYNSQRAGRSAHSPRSCLPGGGWQIKSLTQRTLPGVRAGREALRVNRVLIQLGMQRELVYYWFQQRGRVITNEYMAKGYLFWDALTRNRTDGALVRLVVALPPGGTIAAADRQLTQFAAAAAPTFAPYIPD